LGGQVQVMFDFIPSSVEYIRNGKLRALGVTTTARADALPDVPTLGESVPGYEASGWFGLGAPRNTPGEIIEAINKETNAILMDEKVKARLADIGGTALVGSPTDFGKLIGVESEKWAKVVKFSGAKPGYFGSSGRITDGPMSAKGPGCVKSRTGQKCVESISLLPSRDGGCWHYSIIRSTKSRRKFQVQIELPTSHSLGHGPKYPH
jgi:hypothetical protein